MFWHTFEHFWYTFDIFLIYFWYNFHVLFILFAAEAKACGICWFDVSRQMTFATKCVRDVEDQKEKHLSPSQRLCDNVLCESSWQASLPRNFGNLWKFAGEAKTWWYWRKPTSPPQAGLDLHNCSGQKPSNPPTKAKICRQGMSKINEPNSRKDSWQTARNLKDSKKIESAASQVPPATLQMLVIANEDQSLWVNRWSISLTMLGTERKDSTLRTMSSTGNKGFDILSKHVRIDILG